MEVYNKLKLEDCSTSAKKRKSYTREFKLKVVDMAENKSNRQAARAYNIDESSVRLWRRKKEDIDQMSCNQKSTRHGVPKWPNLETELCCWIKEQRARGKDISTVRIRTMARTLAVDHGIKDFVGGPSWCFRFMKRNGLFVKERGKIEQEESGNTAAHWEESLQESLMQLWARKLLGQTLGNIESGDEVTGLGGTQKEYSTVAVQTDEIV